MYTTKPRPAPSKAALRVLYQLAYISSGTAVGVGVLCAEERRRRTQIVQRIADNAKRIRQHPRYVTNAALATRSDDGLEGELLQDGGEGRGPDWWDQEAAGHHIPDRGGGRTVKGPGMPSVVERGYNATVSEKDKRKRPSRHTQTGDSSLSTGGDLPVRGFDALKHLRMRHPGNGLLSRRPLRSSSERLHIRRLDRADRLTVSQMRKEEPSLSTIFGPQNITEAFDDAISRKDLAECARILRAYEARDALMDRIEAFICACDRQGEHELLLATFFRTEPLLNPKKLKRLSGDTRSILANACCADEELSYFFEILYRSLDVSHRRLVDQRRCDSLLKVTWRSTGNLDTVHAQMHRLREHMERVGSHPASLRLVDEAMAKIYTNANRTGDALNALARLYRTEPSDIRCNLQAANLYARAQSWEQCYEALKLAQTELSANRVPDGRLWRTKVREPLDAIVGQYCKHHSASQTWTFVTYLQEKFDYWPNDFVNRKILISFVGRKAISLIPHWLRMLKVAGRPFEINDGVAATLMKRYYEVHRPSHVLIMWFCRNLSRLVPSFDPLAFQAVIRQSIGYDLSGVIERNSPRQQDHARLRLNRVESATEQIPYPGHKHSGKLYIDHAPEAAPPQAEPSEWESTGNLDHSSPKGAIFDPLRSPIQAVEDVMRTQLSLGRNEEVLRLYDDSLGQKGLPRSPLTLSFAVRASLTTRRSEYEALGLIEHAESVGVNVVDAMARVLNYRMRLLDPNVPDVDKLRSLVFKYYETAEASGKAPSHHIGSTAANIFIQSGRPTDGLDLLRAIYRSSYTRDRPVDIVFMTVMVRGYFARRSLPDVLHWVGESLKTDLRISPGFLRELKRGLKTISSRRQRARLVSCIQTCQARRDEQAFEAKILGKKLVTTLARCMRPERTVDIDARAELDHEVFNDGDPTASVIHQGAAAPGARKEQHTGPVENVRHSNRLTDTRWLRKYRAFLRQPMVLEDGRYVSFRYNMPSQSMKFRTKDRTRRQRLRERREAHWEDGYTEDAVIDA